MKIIPIVDIFFIKWVISSDHYFGIYIYFGWIMRCFRKLNVVVNFSRNIIFNKKLKNIFLGKGVVMTFINIDCIILSNPYW